ncbi:MAG: hypothetical protein ACTSQE_02765 [Candidatus Heimdallarchaeaceae archaeon]
MSSKRGGTKKSKYAENPSREEEGFIDIRPGERINLDLVSAKIREKPKVERG